jgi:PrtD family type I secretion system ABC transporter
MPMKTVLQLLRRPLLHVAGLSFFVNLLLLVPALFMLQVFDRVLASQSGETLLMLLLGVGVALALLLALDYLRARLQGVAGNIVAESLSPAVTKIVVAHGARRSGRGTSESLRDVGSLRALFSAQGLLALFDAPWAIVYVAVIWLPHPVLGWAAAGAAVLMLALALLNDFVTRREIEELQKAAAGATRYLEASLQNAEVAQTLGMTDALVARWRQKNAEVTALQQPTATKTVAMAALTRTVRQVVQVLMMALGAYLVISGEASSGVMIATTTLLGRALAPVELIVGSWRILAEGRAAFRRLREMLNGADAQPQRMTLPAPTGQLVAQNLVFRATEGERLLIAGVSLQLAAGESLAIIGASGAGKSTLVRLLTGVWKPSAGTVRLDNADLAQWPRDELGPWLGYVPQDVELFPGTVAENIARLGEVDSAQVVRAAQQAQVHELILALPNGYDTIVDPQAALISPGQRQRIALARALYGEPKLVILDEPNSNLDGAGEVALGETLKALRGHATVVVVTHRATLIQHVDKVLVLDAGKVQHYGPTAEVLRAMQQKLRQRAVAAMSSRCRREPRIRMVMPCPDGPRGAGIVSDALTMEGAPQTSLEHQLAEAAGWHAARAGARARRGACRRMAGVRAALGGGGGRLVRQGRLGSKGRAARRRGYGARGEGARRPACRKGRAALGARRRLGGCGSESPRLPRGRRAREPGPARGRAAFGSSRAFPGRRRRGGSHRPARVRATGQGADAVQCAPRRAGRPVDAASIATGQGGAGGDRVARPDCPGD